MKLYRVSLQTLRDGHEGYEWFTSRAEATKRANSFKRENKRNCPESTMVSEFDVEPNRLGIIRALNRFASHPNNG